MPTDPLIPPAPVVLPEEIWSGTPNVVLDGERYAIGWQRFPGKKGGPAYVTARRSALGLHKVVGRYPLTADGWACAWTELTKRAPTTANKTRAALGKFYAARPPAGVLAYIPGLILSTIDPPVEGFPVGQPYDLRFGEDSLQIAPSPNSEATVEYRYADVAAVQLTGFERVVTASTIKQVAYAAFYRYVTPPHEDLTEPRTYLRVQTVDRILDFAYPAVFSPEYFRRWLEPVNLAIRQAWLSAAADNAERRTEWLVSELSRLAERLEHGTLTGSDFDVLKARIISGD